MIEIVKERNENKMDFNNERTTNFDKQHYLALLNEAVKYLNKADQCLVDCINDGEVNSLDLNNCDSAKLYAMEKTIDQQLKPQLNKYIKMYFDSDADEDAR